VQSLIKKVTIGLLEYERRKAWIIDLVAYVSSLLPKRMQIDNILQDKFKNEHFDELMKFVENTEPDITSIPEFVGGFVAQMCNCGVDKNIALDSLILVMDDYVYTHNCTPSNTSLVQEALNTNMKDTGIQVFTQSIIKCSRKLSLDYSYTQKTLNSRLKYFYLIDVREFGLEIKIVNLSKFIKNDLKVAFIQIGDFCKPKKHIEYEDSKYSYVNLFLEKDIQEQVMTNIKIQIIEALRLGADVLVFPELVGSEEIVNLIHDLIISLKHCDDLKNRKDFIVICPSFHMKLSSGQYKNVTRILGGDGSLIANVEKINPAHIKDKKDNKRFLKENVIRVHIKDKKNVIRVHIKAKKRFLKENIIPGDTLYLFSIDHIGNMALLICADCFSNFLQYILNECNVKLIIAPSFSPKTAQFDKIFPAFAGNAAIELYWNACSALLNKTNGLIGKICHHDDKDNPLRIMCSGVCEECKEYSCSTNETVETEYFYSETIRSGAGCITVIKVKKI